jgi:crotonobetainyl-CoA:carnitine CoA-transferase CaiB-like acyl-CoA transferase
MSALKKLTVLDLTRVRAGPTCCRVLADFGADVIKIEAPAGVDPNEGMSGARHGYDMLNLHRNKRSLTLNLKKRDGLAIFLKMVESADVVVENFRPDVKNRLGFDYDALSAINPRIILASISGFGQDGPYAKRAGFDQIAQGMGGLMALTGNPGEGPMRAGAAVADSSSGLYAAIGILTALEERHSSGKGQWIQTSLLQAQIAMMDFQAARYLVDGKVPQQAGNDHPYATPMGVIKTKNGHINLGVGGDGHWLKLADALEQPNWRDDPEFLTGENRFKNREEIWQMLRPVFATKTSEEWMDLLNEYGVPAGPIYSMDQLFEDPQVQHLKVAQPVEHHARGTTRLVAQPITLSRTPASITKSAPDAGEHTNEILRQFGFDEMQITQLHDEQVI